MGQFVRKYNSPIYGTVKKGVYTGEGIFYEEDYVKWPVESGGSGQ